MLDFELREPLLQLEHLELFLRELLCNAALLDNRLIGLELRLGEGGLGNDEHRRQLFHLLLQSPRSPGTVPGGSAAYLASLVDNGEDGEGGAWWNYLLESLEILGDMIQLFLGRQVRGLFSVEV